MWDCGTPMERCAGTKTFVVGTRLKNYKLHSDRASAARCQQEHVRRRNEEAGPGEPRLIPSKPQRVRRGKTVEGKGSRWMAPAIRG